MDMFSPGDKDRRHDCRPVQGCLAWWQDAGETRWFHLYLYLCINIGIFFLNLCFQMRSNEMIQDDTPCWGPGGQGLRTESDCRAWIYNVYCSHVYYTWEQEYKSAGACEYSTAVSENKSTWETVFSFAWATLYVQLYSYMHLCVTVFVHASVWLRTVNIHEMQWDPKQQRHVSC